MARVRVPTWLANNVMISQRIAVYDLICRLSATVDVIVAERLKVYMLSIEYEVNIKTLPFIY